MKKILALIGAIGLTATSSLAVVACGFNSLDKSETTIFLKLLAGVENNLNRLNLQVNSNYRFVEDLHSTINPEISLKVPAKPSKNNKTL
jgi:hypothetical protein